MSQHCDLFLLPIGWAQGSIGDLCELNPKHSRDLHNDLLVSFVPMAAISEIKGEIIEAIERPLGEVRKGFTHFANGDVLFAKITPCMENGKAASVRNLTNGIGCGTTEFYVFRQNGCLDQDYLFYFIRQEEFRRAARAQMQSGVGQARVPKEFVLNTVLPIPPLSEQNRIVTAIESLQQRSAKARTLLTEVEPLIDKLRQSILQSAFSGRLTADWRAKNQDVEPTDHLLARIRVERRQRWEDAELAKFEAKGKTPTKGWRDKYKEPEPVDESGLPVLPKGWCWVPLELLAKHQSGFAFKSKDFTSDGVQVVKLGNLYQGILDLSRDPSYMPIDKIDANAAKITDGDILISQTGTRHKRDYGFFVLVPKGSPSLLLNQRVMSIKPIIEELTTWLLLVTRTDFYRDHFFSLETGGVNQGNVGVNGIMRGPIPIPPISELMKISKIAKNSLNKLDSLSAEINCARSHLIEIDQSILSKAFRGELVSQHPDDEPAAELLARIRAARQENPSKKNNYV